MQRAYVAGKLSAPTAEEYIQNVHTMMKHADKIRKQGYAVFVPCLDMLMGTMFGNYSYEDYAGNNLEWVKVCDVLFVCPDSHESFGTNREIEIAKKHGIEIVFL
jgi:hypothetical protein